MVRWSILLFVSCIVLSGCAAATDSDGDKVPDAKEKQLGLDPQVADTDHDGLDDGQEVNDVHSDPKQADTDHDGATDGNETQQGTDPTNATSVPATAGPLHPTVDAARLLALHKDFVTANGERAANKPTHESARQALLGYFASYGLETYRQNFTTGSLADQANILGIKWGDVRDEWVVVGGHYDTTDQVCAFIGGVCVLRSLSQGAYDDGSGTMMTVHLAEAFSKIHTHYTLVFVAYDGEELGTQGAAAFVNEFVTGGGEGKFPTPYGQIKVVGDVDLDMIGLNYPGTTTPIETMTNSEKLWAEAKGNATAQGFPDDMIYRTDGALLGSSDYARFWEVTPDNGGPIPTIFFISDFDAQGVAAPVPSPVHTPGPVGYYPWWHFEDTIETMTAMAGTQANLEAGFQSSATIAAHMVEYLANAPAGEVDAVPK